MASTIQVTPVGKVERTDDGTFVCIHPSYADALLGVEGFSHLLILYWFHENDTPEKRATFRVHPRKDPANPLQGVFATHAPVRPNLIGLTCCRLVAVDGLRLKLDGLDALDGSPVLDIKPYLGFDVPADTLRMPQWVQRRCDSASSTDDP